MPHHTYIIYKPYQMLSQFSREVPQHVTLADLDYDFPKDVYPVGRLDADSEGLLLLTNDKSLNQKILNPKRKKPKTYWVQVDGAPDDEALQPIREGLTIRIKKKEYHTLPAEASLLDPPDLPERVPPIRVRKNIPANWISISLIEGKNRQVRRMCAAIGYPVLRLIRVSIADYTLGEGVLRGMMPGDVIEL